eukprot:c1742_g1_i1.p1 GENE.c1742_g1_i1~~c1742_g1_i1.p1  ORF type:complete len:266 (-),score=73.49 c1742_g1_i1:42-839(-)
MFSPVWEGRLLEILHSQTCYWFGQKNLSRDTFFKRKILSNPDHYVSLDILLSFQRFKSLCPNMEYLIKALEKSTELELSPDRKMVRAKIDYSLSSEADEQEGLALTKLSQLVSNNQYLEASQYFQRYFHCSYVLGYEKCDSGDPDKFRKSVHQKCYHYLHSIQWVISYYLGHKISWDHYYPYYYSPLCVDLAEFTLESQNSSVPLDFSFPESSPPSPFTALMSIISPSSDALLPVPLRPLMSSNEKLKPFFPLFFELDRRGNYFF